MSNTHEFPDFTILLKRMASGDRSVEEQLFPVVYAELKRLARIHLRNERADHTLQPTDLVHEAYLRLTNAKSPEWEDRIHFLAFAARLMRHILVDHARQKKSARRGGGAPKLIFDDGLRFSHEQCGLVADLDKALDQLAKLHSRKAQIVELRFFGGLTEEEIAGLLGVSSRTVKRDWVTTRAWLYGQMSK